MIITLTILIFEKEIIPINKSFKLAWHEDVPPIKESNAIKNYKAHIILRVSTEEKEMVIFS